MCQVAWPRRGRNAHGLRRDVHASVDVVADVIRVQCYRAKMHHEKIEILNYDKQSSQ